MPGTLSTTMILVTLETQKMSLFHISSWLFPRHLKLDMFKDELFISSLLQSGPSHQPLCVGKWQPTFAQARTGWVTPDTCSPLTGLYLSITKSQTFPSLRLKKNVSTYLFHFC